MGTPKSKKKPGKVAEAKSEVVAEIPLACADEAEATRFMERRRWGDTPCCPHCGSVNVYRMGSAEGGRNKDRRWRCRDCKRLYSVRTGTVMEESRIPLRHWAYAFWAACASKKGVSAKQIQRQTGLSYKSALFLMHRIRFAMTPDASPGPKLSGIVEVDETYCGGRPRHDRETRAKWSSKVPVVASVARGGQVRARVVPNVTPFNLRQFVMDTVEPGTTIVTDELPAYKSIAGQLGTHKTVRHRSKEYVRHEDGLPVTTNTAEGFFSLLKRGLYGTFHSVSREHLHRYVGEFCFRYNTREMDDGERTETAIRQAQGRRLSYRAPVAI
jgi:transposase-like protein